MVSEIAEAGAAMPKLPEPSKRQAEVQHEESAGERVKDVQLDTVIVVLVLASSIFFGLWVNNGSAGVFAFFFQLLIVCICESNRK